MKMMEFKGQKVLVVEDNLMSFKLIEAHLLRRNLTLVHAGDGKKALELFRSEPDLAAILMDIQLPGLNGLEVTIEIRKEEQNIPIIATTANAYDEDRQACEEAGFTNFVTKPINFDELFNMLEEYIH